MKKLKFLLFGSFGCLAPVFGESMLLSQDSDINLIHADTAEYKEGEILLSGNVQVKYDDKDIYAQELHFFTDNNNIKAIGDIKIVDEKGNTCTADSILIENKSKKSSLSKAKLVLADKSHVEANNAEFFDKDYFNVSDAEYSPCYNCVVGNKLTWDIKAKEVEQHGEYVSYKDAVFYFLGTPVMYLPYFSHPSFTVKRKSGFLAPLITHNTSAGFSVVPKYLVSISKSQELILKPIITSKIGPIFWSSYGYRFMNGKLNIDASITGTKSVERNRDTGDYEKKELDRIKRHHMRGHLFADFRYDINKEYRLLSSVNLVSDKYYLKKIPFLGDTEKRILESNVGLEKFSEKNYASLRMMYFQTLRSDENASDIPIALPVFSCNNSYELFDGTLDTDIFAVRLDFPNKHITNKVFANLGWSKDFVGYLGHVFSVELKGLSSLNRISYNRNAETVSGRNRNNYSVKEFSPLCKLALKWPWEFKVNGNFSYILEPTVGIVVLANRKTDFSKFNDQYTSLSLFELDDANFMESLRSNFSGQINDTSRIPYGLRSRAYWKGENILNFTIGRSLAISSPDKIEKDVSDINRRHSNIIFRMDAMAERKISLFSDGSFNDNTGKFQRLETGVLCKHKIFDIKVSSFYNTKIEKQGTIFKEKKYNGLHTTLGVKATKNLTLKYSMVFGGCKNKMLKSSLGVSYSNECFSADLVLAKTNFRAVDIKPSKSITLLVSFKNLGNYKLNL